MEGREDEVALRGLLPSLASDLGKAIENGVLTVMPLHGAGKMNYLLTQRRDSLATMHAFLDDNDAGRSAAKAAEDAGLLTRRHDDGDVPRRKEGLGV